MGVLDILEPVYSVLPAVRPPETEPPLKRKLMWSGLALLIFFILGQINVVGLAAEAEEQLIGFQEILASQTGSLITAGIGPIVLSSIILQLLVGGKIIGIDLTNPKDRARFQGLQKLFAIVLCFFEGIVYPMSGLLAPQPGMLFIVAGQIALGSIILLYLDEVVSKYGIGSGIGLFIAGGVSGRFFWQVFMMPGVSLDFPAGGALWRFLGSFGVPGGPSWDILLPIVLALVIFLVVIYANAMHVNIPITMGRKGMGGRYPVKFLYVSVLPVILAVALFANVRIWALMAKGIPVVGQAMAGLTWATGSSLEQGGAGVYGLFTDILRQVGAMGLFDGLAFMGPRVLQGIVYLALLVVACVLFGKFWVKMGGQSPEDVARQLQSSGMYIPGFRRDPRIIERVLNRYIPPITILGSIFVGLLAGIGNMALGTLASGTGILLTVGIVYRIYEELARTQLVDSHPLIRKMLG